MSSLLIDGKKIIDLQLTATAPTELRCATGQTTLIVPARQTPCPARPASSCSPHLLNSPYLSIIDDVQEDLLSGKNSLQVFIDRMAREWGNMRNDPTCLGGAYFPWFCSGSGNNPWGWVRWGEDADWGVVTADLLPKPQFWGLRAAYSPVHFPTRAIWEKGADFFEIELENQFNSIDLKDCVLRTQLNGGGKWEVP